MMYSIEPVNLIVSSPISMIAERCALASKHGEIQVKTNASISIVALFFYLQSAFLFYAITLR